MSREDGEAFAKRLSEAMFAIKIREEKNLSVIGDELGYAIGRDGGSAITHWRRGYVPAKLSDVEKLAREILRRTDLGNTWLEGFYSAAGMSDNIIKASDLYVLEVPEPQPTHHAVTHRPYPRKIVGRPGLIDELVTALHRDDTPAVVTVDGMGGIGKTALVSWVAKICIEQKIFDELIWITAATSTYPKLLSVDTGALTFELVLDNIGDHLQIPGIARLSRTEKELRIETALSSRHTLVVVDNLESSRDSQNEIAQQLQSILGNCRAVVISRHRFTGDYYSVHLQGLNDEDGVEFLYSQATLRRVNRVASAGHGDLVNIAEATGGSPLAMKLVLGQLFHLPLPSVLDHLTNARPVQGRSDNDDYVNLYRYIFMPSWGLLEPEAEQLLVGMAHFAPGVGDIMDLIQKVSELDDRKLISAIDQLWQVSFLEVDESSALRRVRYYLHALTQNFVLSDMVKTL